MLDVRAPTPGRGLLTAFLLSLKVEKLISLPVAVSRVCPKKRSTRSLLNSYTLIRGKDTATLVKDKTMHKDLYLLSSIRSHVFEF